MPVGWANCLTKDRSMLIRSAYSLTLYILCIFSSDRFDKRYTYICIFCVYFHLADSTDIVYLYIFILQIQRMLPCKNYSSRFQQKNRKKNRKKEKRKFKWEWKAIGICERIEKSYSPSPSPWRLAGINPIKTFSHVNFLKVWNCNF